MTAATVSHRSRRRGSISYRSRPRGSISYRSRRRGSISYRSRRRGSIGWSPKQERVLEAINGDAPGEGPSVVCVHGPVQCGKSMSTVHAFALFASTWWTDTDFIIASRTSRQTDAAIVRYLREFSAVAGAGLRHRREHYELGSLLGGANRIYPLVGSDRSSAEKARSFSVGGALLDEATVLPPDFVSAVADRCSLPGARLVLTTNPAGPQHAIKRDYIDEADGHDMVQIGFQLADNHTLTDSYIAGLHRRYYGAMYQRMVLGEWAASEGLIYPYLADIIGPKPPDNQFHRWSVGIDWAHSSVTAAVMVGRTSEGVQWIVDEWYHDATEQGQLPEKEQARRIARWIRQGDRNIRVVCVDPSARGLIRALRIALPTINVVGSDNNVKDGIQYVRGLMEQGLLRIADRCTHTIRSHGNYRYDERAGQMGEDRPIKEDDHVCDAARYVLWTTGYRPPRNLRVVRRRQGGR